MQYFRIEVVVVDSIFAQFSWFGMRYTGTSLFFVFMCFKDICFSFNSFCGKYKKLKIFQDSFESKAGPSTQYNQEWNRHAFSQNNHCVSFLSISVHVV